MRHLLPALVAVSLLTGCWTTVATATEKNPSPHIHPIISNIPVVPGARMHLPDHIHVQPGQKPTAQEPPAPDTQGPEKPAAGTETPAPVVSNVPTPVVKPPEEATAAETPAPTEKTPVPSEEPVVENEATEEGTPAPVETQAPETEAPAPVEDPAVENETPAEPAATPVSAPEATEPVTESGKVDQPAAEPAPANTPALTEEAFLPPSPDEFHWLKNEEGGYAVPLPLVFGPDPLADLPATGPMLVRGENPAMFLAVTVDDSGDKLHYRNTDTLPEIPGARLIRETERYSKPDRHPVTCIYQEAEVEGIPVLVVRSSMVADKRTYRTVSVFPRSRWNHLIPRVLFTIDNLQTWTPQHHKNSGKKR